MQGQLDELSEWKAEQQAEVQARDNAIHIEREFHRLTGESWADDNPSHDAIVQFALNADDGSGQTNVQAGFDQYQKLRDWVIEDLKQSKAAPSPDQFGSSSASAAPVDNASLDDRVRLAMERNGL